MTRARRGPSPHQDSASQSVSKTRTKATVASLGVQARLVRVDPDHVRDLADLIVASESLRQEWDRLLTRLIDRLREEARNDCVDRCSNSPSHD